MVVTRMNLPQSWTDTGQTYLKTKICYAQRKVEAVPGVIGWPRKLACWQTDYTREVSDSLQKAITRVSLKVVVGSRRSILTPPSYEHEHTQAPINNLLAGLTSLRIPESLTEYLPVPLPRMMFAKSF